MVSEINLLERSLAKRFIWVVLNRPIFVYCDGSQNRMEAIGSLPYGKKHALLDLEGPPLDIVDLLALNQGAFLKERGG